MSSPDLSKTPPAETSSSGERGAPAGLRVLLVEDHEDTRRGMEILLRRDNHRVRSVGTARKAIEVAGEEEFDVVITDIGLPDLSGVELMTRLHAVHGLQGIVISGYRGDDVQWGANDPFLHHLTKPISMDRLRELLAGLQNQKNAES